MRFAWTALLPHTDGMNPQNYIKGTFEIATYRSADRCSLTPAERRSHTHPCLNRYSWAGRRQGRVQFDPPYICACKVGLVHLIWPDPHTDEQNPSHLCIVHRNLAFFFGVARPKTLHHINSFKSLYTCDTSYIWCFCPCEALLKCICMKNCCEQLPYVLVGNLADELVLTQTHRT